ncbi:ADF-H domain-containing protein [Mycena kentingensis (nom. inval.)]|nr:ADF-H domain-containing protein [Mycena kentingensis (nom. inval.)]
MAAQISFTNEPLVLDAYNAILSFKTNWLLLAYDLQQPDASRGQLFLEASGPGGLPQLKSHIQDLGQVFFGFLRDEGVPDGYILLNIIPASVSGVRRARALVHSRRIGAVFQAHRTSLTVDHLSNLTPRTVRTALLSPDAVHVIQLDRNSQAVDEMGKLPEPLATNASPPSSSKANITFSSLLRRKKRNDSESEPGAVVPFNIHISDRDEPNAPPPPPPPKDAVRRSNSTQPTYTTPSKGAPLPIPPQSQPLRPHPHPIATRPRSISDYTVVSRASTSSDEVVVVRPDKPVAPILPMKHRSVTLPAKWNTEVLDPAERRRRRLEMQRQREIDEEEALEEEVERQRQIKIQKEMLLREQEEEEAQRRASLEKEIKFVSARRRQREELERLEEERRKREIEEKKRIARERRLAEHRRLEQWRKEQAAHAEEEARLAQQTRRREVEENKRRIQQAATRARNAKGNPELLSGVVTMQNSLDSLTWRRRHYKFVGTTVFFYRSPKDLTVVLEQFDIRGQVAALREWYDGYEDLKAIPFSFAVEFKGERSPWAMFTDNEDDKYKLLGLLQANGT